ncbi:hypothetical protein N7447_010047 [Penicillium robsamsonii]|uniref:uncharacterized protein n=1 Tax=Penicillium robsamsonii TaxID=1792511 RepID=UPI002547D08E|nr:uncharacterized protein N7447_010047 [Penicillium robsamsonii]KAJ5813024.1 hypothetical protein N7447_010047 [Penicillium robsamsonii]
MSLDRVIQDSDEDEPFEGDDLSTSVDPVHPSELALQEYQHSPAKERTHNAVYEHGPAPDETTFSQLNVNFDEFIQSPERGHSMLSSSQQRREDRWIPSTSEGGSGSVGAMMTEIGIAQRRLLDDDHSSASLLLPSTAALYSTESFQSALFPTIPSYHSYLMDQPNSGSLTYNPAPIGAYVDANQTLLPITQGTYDMTPPETTNSMASSSKIVPHQATEPFMEQENPPPNLPQEASQPKSQQMGPSSPHDTEPLSSVTSMRFSETKTTTAGTSFISPQQSQSSTSTHDELALPAVLPTAPDVETSGVTKKQGRPKKKPMPDNDEDDELANSRDHEFKHPGANGAIDPSDSEETTKDNTPASSGVSDETDEDNLGATSKLAKSGPKEPKKEKAKKSKTTPTPVPGADDDVIWVDTKPLSSEPSTKKATPLPEAPEAPREDLDSNVLDSNPPVETQTLTPAVEEKTQKPAKPAPKKRGRKRKQTADQAETPSESADTPEPNKAPSGAQTPASKLAVVVDNSPRPMLEANAGDNDASTIQSETQNPHSLPGPDPLPESTIDTSQPQPQTPSKSDAASINTPQNTGKGPDKHSPISVRSGVPYRVGLSKRARIAPLLKMVRK